MQFPVISNKNVINITDSDSVKRKMNGKKRLQVIVFLSQKSFPPQKTTLLFIPILKMRPVFEVKQTNPQTLKSFSIINFLFGDNFRFTKGFKILYKNCIQVVCHIFLNWSHSTKARCMTLKCNSHGS